MAPPRPDPDPVELTADPRFANRIVRLAVTAAIMLGVVYWLAERTLQPSRNILDGLAGGWVLMPVILALSLRWPFLRYALIVPSALVSMALLALCVTVPVDDSIAAAGWLLLTAGVLFGGLLGIWFWFRWLPVPRALHEPFSPARWALIGVHVGMIVGGIGLVAGRWATHG